MEPMRICFATSELAPLAKTGGLADVSGALCRFLKAEGHDVRPFLPFYKVIDRNKLHLAPVEHLQGIPLELGGREFSFSVYSATTPPAPGSLGSDYNAGDAAQATATGPHDLAIYLVHCTPLFGRESLYTDDPDEHLRFILFTRAVFESCQRMGWSPQIIHCNDWQTALAPAYLKSLYGWDRLFEETQTVLTIHNLAFQGTYPSGILDDTGLSEVPQLFHDFDMHRGWINFLKTGILWADSLTTVSPTYAREIQTEELGMGLDEFLRRRKNDLHGILNGVDYTEWSPETDPFIPHSFSIDDMAGKKKNRAALLESVGLTDVETAPVLGLVSRLTGQKGLDLLETPLPPLLEKRDFRLVVLGSGEKRFETFFRDMATKFPEKVHFHNGFSNELAHLIEAGSDAFLMPSRYEPCGLNQMYSLRYGTVPIVRRTGGLADTVKIYDPDTKEGTGIVFDYSDEAGMKWALETALGLFAQPETWKTIVANGMKQDYSWEQQGALYLELYRSLLDA